MTVPMLPAACKKHLGALQCHSSEHSSRLPRQLCLRSCPQCLGAALHCSRLCHQPLCRTALVALLLWRPHHILLHRSAPVRLGFSSPQQGSFVFIFSQHAAPLCLMRLCLELMACSSLQAFCWALGGVAVCRSLPCAAPHAKLSLPVLVAYLLPPVVVLLPLRAPYPSHKKKTDSTPLSALFI